ncbi:MAG: DUF4255 domain-containing protein [Rhodocyclaceae bacterium]|nr:DUF4255 domain-containing protein [Rhodocyclaceae bacterium]MBX3667526.1 DUF4255 domain-containing protein [Rhodocyclaceae bacterium]
MIADALLFLRDRLNRHFKSFSSASDTGASEDKVVFLDGDQKADSISFKLDKLTVLLYRVEKETSLPCGDPFVRAGPNGSSQRVRPDISMNLYVLLVAKFADYAQGLNYLSQAVRFFQSNNVFDRQSAPELGGEIAELALDLVSLTTQQQNELWGLFRTHYVPSVAYRIRTVVFLDEAAQPSAPAVGSLNRRGLN